MWCKTTERDIAVKETGRARDDASSEVIYKIEIPANRYVCSRARVLYFSLCCSYDLLCAEGLIRALRIFRGLEEVPNYVAVPAAGSSEITMTVKPEVILQNDFHHVNGINIVYRPHVFVPS